MTQASDPASPPSRGIFVTFEGGEGSGKTTQIERLGASLRAQGFRVVATREPGGSPGADALREILLSGAAQTLGNDMETILFAAARIDHIANVIRPALLRGDHVLCDRFLDSTRVYQGAGTSDDSEFFRILEDATIDGLVPDLTLVLDLPAQTGLQRATARRGQGAADRFEREGVAVHEARRQAFLRIAQAEPERCIVIDAAQDEGRVEEAIRQVVASRLDRLPRHAGPARALSA